VLGQAAEQYQVFKDVSRQLQASHAFGETSLEEFISAYPEYEAPFLVKMEEGEDPIILGHLSSVDSVKEVCCVLCSCVCLCCLPRITIPCVCVVFGFVCGCFVHLQWVLANQFPIVAEISSMNFRDLAGSGRLLVRFISPPLRLCTCVQVPAVCVAPLAQLHPCLTDTPRAACRPLPSLTPPQARRSRL